MSRMMQRIQSLFKPMDLSQGSCWRTILRFSLPIILSYLLQQVYSISDAAIVGQTLASTDVASASSPRATRARMMRRACGGRWPRRSSYPRC